MMLEDLYRLLKSSHVQAQGIVDTLSHALLVLDQSYSIVTANNAFLHTFKVDREEVVDRSIYSLGNGQWDIPGLRTLFDAVIPKSVGVIGYEVTHDFPNIGNRTFIVDAQRLVHPDNNSMNILVQFEDVTERHRHEAEKDFVIAETNHRMKNLFSIIRAIAHQTEIEDRTAAEYRETFLGRLDVAMRAQEISFNTQHTDFGTLLEKTVKIAGEGRFDIDTGPPVELPRSRVLPISLMLHELTTNAMKYGALSASVGGVHISWRVDPSEAGETFLVCEWRERGGPPCYPPKTRGYGTELIEGTARHLGGSANLEFDSSGLIATIKFPA